MEMHSALLSLCEEKSLITDGFPTQRVINLELYCFVVNVLLNGQSS